MLRDTCLMQVSSSLVPLTSLTILRLPAPSLRPLAHSPDRFQIMSGEDVFGAYFLY
jgi:hypothetical protein